MKYPTELVAIVGATRLSSLALVVVEVVETSDSTIGGINILQVVVEPTHLKQYAIVKLDHFPNFRGETKTNI